MSQSYFDTESKTHKSFELPGARPQYNPDRPGQVEHIFLDLTLDIPLQRVSGTCTITLKPIRNGIKQLVLDAVNLTIASVQVDQIPQPFDYDGEQLQIHLLNPAVVGKAIKIAIAYSVDNPQRGIYFIHPNQHYPNKPTQVWTQGEDEDSRFWFPCFDYPGQLATSEIRVRLPKPLIAISNGELIATEEDGNETIYHWRQQEVHPTYLMTLAVGDFAEIRDEWQGKPVNYYVEKGREEDARRSMGKTPGMIEFLSETFAYPYPYPKYAQVCVDDFIFGGMENTSTTLLTDRCLVDERAAIDNQRTESLVVHELAHQWFGDLVVIKHWSHAWIKEGMASYTEVFWTENEYGKDDAAYYLLNEARSYISEDSSRYRRPMVTHVYREAIELYDRHLYEKGACVYHMIRAELGEDLFWKAIQTFVQDNAHKTVETIDLLRAIEKATGRNLLFLFDQYVFRGGHPDYKVAYSWDGDSQLAKLTVTQTQAKDSKTGSDSELFDLKIPIAFGYTQLEDDSPVKTSNETCLQKFTVRVHEREQSFYFPLAKKPNLISFDHGNNYLKTVSLEYPIAELKAQLKFDPDPISRIYAGKALAKKGGLEAVQALSDALTSDSFWGVRLEIAKQLAKVKLDQAEAALIAGLSAQNPRVRRAVVQALGDVKTPESYNALKQLLEKGDASYYVEASAARSLGGMVSASLKDREDEVIQLLTKVLQERSGWNEVVRSGAIGGLSQIKSSPIALDVILEYTTPGIPQPLRITAIRALGEISTGQTPNKIESILEQLEELSRETFYLTQVTIVGALGKMETPKAMDILRSLLEHTPDGRIRRIAEEAIQKVQKTIGSDKAIKQLRDELDKLKKDNQELKSRLENLEAKSNQA
ncbi:MULTISPECIES: M1 family metallopeptidase [Moorena]|uniref:Aminopeptidase N n=2 Tax=Moorena TaxID=1155738 RepID=F4XNP2_9CYAN|nr:MULTISPECIES: M1 family metallopeptidase [Moorena]EGJ33805.1 Aminopeptidase N [Moorena producens 3L]NEP34899.1 M1 family metallopeptidase [Moorena sp. SIO3B2]NEP67859.1 M1 family metallopeptidase [Moorena sp. SIO3A5]NEQ07077.1 M1 family metallopeptidase [Moorena sp. SIO4E2]NER89103.1 M1 family metallopeptidase [Moorena sp. SIO3A2]